MNSAPRVTFDNGGAFIEETRRDVEQYLALGRTRIKGALSLYAKAPIALGLTVVSWCVLMFTGPGPALAALCLVGLVAGSMLTAFCVQHDANHGAYFKRRRWNHLVGWSADSLLGFSSYAWRVKHNVAHHTYTNVDGYDADADADSARPLHRGPAGTPLVPLPAVLHLAHVHAHGAEVADGRRSGRVRAREHRGEQAARPARLGSRGPARGQGVLHRLGDRDPPLVYPWWIVLADCVGFG